MEHGRAVFIENALGIAGRAAGIAQHARIALVAIDPLDLAILARDCRAFVNLIPLHPGGSMGFTPTPRDGIQAFARRIKDRGVEVAIRKSRGTDISAACGQLRVERLARRRPEPAQ